MTLGPKMAHLGVYMFYIDLYRGKYEEKNLFVLNLTYSTFEVVPVSKFLCP